MWNPNKQQRKRQERRKVEVLYVTHTAWQFLNGYELQALTDFVALLNAGVICTDIGYLG
jgi:hypothetical protein